MPYPKAFQPGLYKLCFERFSEDEQQNPLKVFRLPETDENLKRIMKYKSLFILGKPV
ncbi:hypothetical protein Cst_c16790 [Thermoclostridium stercorarium subsp. stercorarium DSM 8532]|jgi:hypothetical protein|uniref:Uncharacterized protein n=1 Tax=Thermoclostridium stercorarium (strain ATCC 35414 / DSM 8532 / NCIMB 11754) TaxID=1121335 RepID=L7VT18_THES1|nr:hypothetical protein Cst_c16790 [Thermoclostridium stercorarium subsp. stercorarium DSM 8532]